MPWVGFGSVPVFLRYLAGLKEVLGATRSVQSDPREDPGHDPVVRARAGLLSDQARLEELEHRIQTEIGAMVVTALAEMPA